MLGQCLLVPREPAWDSCRVHAKGPCTDCWNVLKPLWCHWLLLFLCQCLLAVSCFVHRHRLFGAEAVHSLDVRTVQGIRVLSFWLSPPSIAAVKVRRGMTYDPGKS